MTKKQLLKLNDQLGLWMEQVEDLTQQFNGSGNLTDDVHQFAREYKAVNHTMDIFLTASKLHGVLRNLQFEVTKVILKEESGNHSRLTRGIK